MSIIYEYLRRLFFSNFCFSFDTAGQEAFVAVRDSYMRTGISRLPKKQPVYSKNLVS